MASFTLKFVVTLLLFGDTACYQRGSFFPRRRGNNDGRGAVVIARQRKCTVLYSDFFAKRQGKASKKKVDQGSPSGDSSSEVPKNEVFTCSMRKGISPGLGYSTSLSFKNVYISSIEDSSPLLKDVRTGDLLIKIDGVSVIDLSFDNVMNIMNNALAMGGVVQQEEEQQEEEDDRRGLVDLTFFRGNDESLIKGAPVTATVTVEDGGKIKRFKVKCGRSLRDVLIENGVNPYQSVARFTNCKGKQLCGTCIVNVTEGAQNCNRKSLDEASTLRENDEGYRLSCVTFVYGDVDVKVRPKINPSQWTR